VALQPAEGTVKNHMSNVMGKLGVPDRTQAALKARELGLI
jgi:DNA-binding NarL/FixJ family response regulator